MALPPPIPAGEAPEAAATGDASSRQGLAQWLVSGIFLLGLLILWEVVSSLGVFERSLFPSPSGIAQSFRLWWDNGGLATAVSISLRRALIGYALSLAIGVPLGIAIGSFRFMDWTVGTLVRLLQPIPGIAWTPLAVAWFFSVSETAKIFVVLTGSLFPLVIATSAGVRTVPPLYKRAALTLGVRGLALFTEVIFPACLPSILAGMRISWAFCWRALVAAEIVLATRTGPGQEGLGGLLGVARQFSQIDTAGMVMVLLAALGLAMDGLVFGPLEHRVRTERGL
ncbi:MAG: ABC transporter permease [Chloroflexi bacterium]|nr:ABC transporter permease [Chloroflexota bacterium]